MGYSDREDLPMKKVMPIVLALVIFIASSCQPAQNGNTANSNTQNSNVNAIEENVVFRASDESPQKCMSLGVKEKPVHIMIVQGGAAGCSIQKPTTDVEISINAGEKVRWCVENQCDRTLEVMIDAFSKVDDPSDRNPFGENDRDNIFFTGAIRLGKAKHLVSKVPRITSNGYRYKYYVKLFDTDGSLIDLEDPQVIISDNH
jgi:hypothetical protein